ncbi:hypothetical protein [Kribbella sp.]|uniref:hypothetical protein n=1 Tax=Kribbella sp. TaxID=1871183 RepID=UPI002D6D0202|nr:hypothetical protein [Kribbella sp.]HZX07371.1 hypothetical protein [Kribbella sp.]
MADSEDLVRVDPSSDTYKEFARLYHIAQELHPGGENGWNGELYARTDAKWGGLANDGSIRLNQRLVLDHLTGGERSADPQAQAQALATVLHESKHTRSAIDAPNEPNAVRNMTSVAVNEAFVEISTVDDFRDFADQAGYGGVPDPEPEYQGAVQAGNALLERATSSAEERDQLVNAVIENPTVMGWDTVADSVVRNELADVVPPDPEHQQAARAHLVNQMAIPEWDGVQHRPGRGSMVAELTTEGIDKGVGQIREHYQQNPGEPYPARMPNQAAAVSTEVQNGEQQRAVTNTVGTQLQSGGRAETVDLAKLPPPDAATRIAAGPGQADATRFLRDQAPAAAATHRRPELGDGARGAGAPAAAGISRPGADRGATPGPPGRG